MRDQFVRGHASSIYSLRYNECAGAAATSPVANGGGRSSLLGRPRIFNLSIVHEIGDVIVRLNREERLTVLLVEQKLAFARRVGEHYSLIDRGRCVAGDVMSELSDGLVQRYFSV